jgi:Protein of unknown function (DUF2721)
MSTASALATRNRPGDPIQLTIQTPALLFPAISFLMLAYTNRYSALTRLARDLLRDFERTQADHVIVQIHLVRQRIRIIRVMLTLAAVSIGASSFTILALYEEWETVGKVVFTVSLVLLTVTYALAVAEISQSARALDIQIDATLGRRP